MTIVNLEISAIFISLLASAWFLIGVYRARMSRLSRSSYMEMYEKLCDDDNVPLRLLTSLQTIFAVSCGYCASLHIIHTILVKAPEKDIKLSAEIRALPKESVHLLLSSMASLFKYLTYFAPIIGFAARRLKFEDIYKLKMASKEGSILSAFESLSHTT